MAISVGAPVNLNCSVNGAAATQRAAVINVVLSTIPVVGDANEVRLLMLDTGQPSGQSVFPATNKQSEIQPNGDVWECWWSVVV